MAVIYSNVNYRKYQERETGDGEPSKRSSNLNDDIVYSQVRRVQTTDDPPQRDEAQHHHDDPLTQPASKVVTSGHTTERLLLISLCCLFFVLALTLGVLYALGNTSLRENHATITQLQKQQEDLNRTLQEGDDCCAKGWKYFSGKCYYFSTDKKTWTASRDACVAAGGHLVIVNSTEEQDFLMKSAPFTGEHFYWVGLTDAVKEGDWRWLDGTPLSAKSPMWSSGQPDNWKGEGNKRSEGENCAAIRLSNTSYHLFDKFCDAPKDSFYRVCEAITRIK